MRLIDIRNEVMNKGFDPNLFGINRVNQYINDGYALICRRVDYYIDEATSDFTTTTGIAKYPLPANFARIRELWDTNRALNMTPVGLRDIDISASMQFGAPQMYALDGANVHLWPTPDATYPLELRYWLLPAPLVNDSDVPTLPPDWHHILWVYATWQAYESEDDPNMGQYWMQRFNTELAEFAADQKFPSTDYPEVAKSMWDQDRPLQQKGWTLWGWI